MKKLIYIFSVTILLFSCSPAHQHLQNGNYQAAIEVGARQMSKNPKKADKTILAIERAFKIEKSRILGKINQLKIDGDPKNWISIYNLYKQLDQYQSVLKPILPMYIQKELRNAKISLIDINQELKATKLKAAEFLYLEADRNLSSYNKSDIRDAYKKFTEVKKLYSSFRDVDSKINEAYTKGQNHILISYSNDSRMIIPQEFMTNLKNFKASDLDENWTKHYLNKNAISRFDYRIEVHVASIDIGPEQIKESQYEDVKRVQDGYQYVLDGKGNVAKDTLGNDIKEPKYINVKALITKSEQTKVGVLTGVIDYKNTNSKVFKSFPFREDMVFQNFFATAQGDNRAISQESQTLLGGRPLPFPQDVQMVMDASELIKVKTFNIIKANVALVYD